MAGMAKRFFGNFGWALALAGSRGRGRWLRHGSWLYRGGRLLDRPLPLAGAIPLALVAASLFAVR